jgi:multidrug resistance efflux pump
MERLVKNKTVSEAEFDMAKATRDSLKEKIAALDTLISEMEDSLKKMKPPAELHNTTNNMDTIASAIEARRKAIELASKPMIIKAPMAGVISLINKRKGEKVVRGDAIVVISSMGSERVIGYVRQPLNLKPKVGDTVEVRSRSSSRPMCLAKVIKVGSQLEAINPVVLPMAVQNGPIEFGLPLLIALPKDDKRFELMPGETVDISMVNNK